MTVHKLQLLTKQEVIPTHEDTLENLVSHLMIAPSSSRDSSVHFLHTRLTLFLDY